MAARSPRTGVASLAPALLTNPTANSREQPPASPLQSGLPTPLPGPTAPPISPSFVWPDWARTARIAGAYFHPDDSEAAIDARLDALAAQHVSIVLADSPWGEQYAAWVDDEEFAAVKAVVAQVVEKAHARGLKVVMYQTGLELLSEPNRNPGVEHPEWPQLALDGSPILFNDVSNEEEHWLTKGVWDFWLSPCSQPSGGTFSELALARVSEMVATGIDGLWVDQVYLQSSVGHHDDLWPSSDPCSAAAFTAATGLSLPVTEDWDSPTFRRWIVWRHSQMVDFLLAEKAAARAINPALVFFNENSSVDSGRSTYVANDPASYLLYPDLSTGHEVETIADRMDEGETGMQAATLDQWLAFRTMIAFARAVDVRKPSWILTYGYQPRDSAQLAGLVLAEGANFYETKGPQMADTAGAAYRTQLFGWIAAHEADLYNGESMAEVGLLYSPRSRDLVDTVSGEPYDASDSVHFAAYRATANLLYRAHIPFDVVIDTHTDVFGRYPILVAPEVQAMSDSTVAALHNFTGTLVTVGDTGAYDEWLNPRTPGALADLSPIHYNTVNKNMIANATTSLLSTNLPPEVQIGLRRRPNAYTILLVNTAGTATLTGTLALRLSGQEQVVSAHLSTLDGKERPLSFDLTPDSAILQLEVPAGIETIGLLTVSTFTPLDHALWLPFVQDDVTTGARQARGDTL